MKKKQNLLLLILAVLFVSLFGGSTAVSAASSFPRLQAVSSGEIVSKNNNLYYRYGQRNYARNKYLRIKGKNYYFDSSGKAWYGMHTINGRKYYFGTRSEGYMYRIIIMRIRREFLLPVAGIRFLPGKNIILTLPAGHTPEKERSTRLLIILTAMVH